MVFWNPWHGCHKISEGCKNCYMFNKDEKFGRNSNIIVKTSNFSLPLKKTRFGEYKLRTKEKVFVCMTSDFFIEEADEWREKVWEIIKWRYDLNFYIVTKRIDRFYSSLPKDWGNGYKNVSICVTCENQKMADMRIPYFLGLPIMRRELIVEPMLEEIKIDNYLKNGTISTVICGGESGDKARICDYDWVLSLRNQCLENNVNFYFKQTGAKFKMNDKIFEIPRKYQMSQADKAKINLGL